MLWEVRSLAVGRVIVRRLATAAIGLLAVLLVVSIPVRLMVPTQSIPSSRLLSWQVSSGFGQRLDPAAAQAATEITIEVEHPGCAPIDVGPWLADPVVSSTPWSVTITMHMNDTAETAGCLFQQAQHEGSLPIVGGYLTGIFYRVPLGEPLGDRMLFDGSSFPPQARPVPLSRRDRGKRSRSACCGSILPRAPCSYSSPPGGPRQAAPPHSRTTRSSGLLDG